MSDIIGQNAEYRSLVGEISREKVIERSKFIAFAAHVAGEDAAREFLDRVRSMHSQATHVCYGFVADRAGNLQRFSDDGEPQGTAGMPILNVLKQRKLCESAIAVVRYFGGIKLGAGGLTRAYAGCAAEVCDGAEVRTYSPGEEVTLSVDYALVNAALKFLEGEIVLSRDFGSCANFRVIVKSAFVDVFLSRARDFFNGKVTLKRGEKYFFAF